jgi:hypothetical protein
MSTISTKNLEHFPSISKLERLLKSLATLDAILCPEWDYRYYSFNSQWAENELMGSMRNGSGDEFYVLFNSDGCFIKGFAHESAMSSWGTENQKPWNGLLNGLPEEFEVAAKEPAFSMENISFCLWKKHTDISWLLGNFEFDEDEDPDGSEYLLELFDCNPATYKEFVTDYHELDVELSLISKIYNHETLTQNIVTGLNPDANFKELLPQLIEIGYPVDDAI